MTHKVRPNHMNGLSLLEMLVSLALLSLLVSLVLSFGKSVHLIHVQRIKAQNQQLDLLMLNAITQRLVRHSDSHRLALLPVIHSNGNIRYSDGTKVQQLFDSPHFAPRASTDAISSLALRTDALLKVKTCSSNGTTLTANVCALSTRSPRLEGTRNVLLVSPESLRVHSGNIRGSGSCRRVIVQRGASLFDDAYEHPLSCSTWLVVPVTDVETYFFDTQWNLRLARFQGPRVIENQPIRSMSLDKDSKISFELNHSELEFILSYQVQGSEAEVSRLTLKNSFRGALARRLSSHLTFNF